MNIPGMGGVRQVYVKARTAQPDFRWLTRVLLSFGFFLCAAPVQAEESELPTYQLGNGYRLGDSGITLGGYGSASVEKLRHEETRAVLDNLSLFVWWEGEGRWKFFSELDYEDSLAWPKKYTPGENRYLALERLYVDYTWSDELSARVGKFLTPIGRWNLIHGKPLVWTTSRPLITERTFPTNTTGLMVQGTLPERGLGIEYSFYASNGTEIRANPAIDPFNEVVGMHLSLPLGATGQIGFSGASFEQKLNRDERKNLVGADFFWSQHGYELSGEGVYRMSDAGSRWDEKGGYLQAVAPLGQRMFAVGRVELFRQSGATETTRRWVAGVNFRLERGLVLKAEWISSDNNSIGAPEGFMSSVSILF
jgi:hypothetical protein